MDFNYSTEGPPRILNINQQAEYIYNLLYEIILNPGNNICVNLPSITRHDLRKNGEQVKTAILNILKRSYENKEDLNKALHFKSQDFVIIKTDTKIIHKADIIKKILEYYRDSELEDIESFNIRNNTYKTFKGKNKKITKLSWDIPNLGNFEKEKAKYGESITPTTIYVTTNPLEILLQGVNSSWSSCNNFLHSHWGECTSHALSRTAFVAFIVSEKFTGDTFLPKKVGRSWLYLEELEKSNRTILAGGGTYQCGEPTDSFSTFSLRQNIVLEVLKHMKYKKDMLPSLIEVNTNFSPGFWDIAHSANRSFILASTNYNQQVKHWLSVSKGVGKTIPCIFCNEETSSAGGICDTHLRGNGVTYCDTCDIEIQPHEIKKINRNTYCKKCYENKFFVCPLCNNTHDVNKRQILHIFRSGEHKLINICNSCATSYPSIKKCNKCGKLIHILYPYHVSKEGNILCIECHDSTQTSN